MTDNKITMEYQLTTSIDTLLECSFNEYHLTLSDMLPEELLFDEETLEDFVTHVLEEDKSGKLQNVPIEDLMYIFEDRNNIKDIVSVKDENSNIRSKAIKQYEIRDDFETVSLTVDLEIDLDKLMKEINKGMNKVPEYWIEDNDPQFYEDYINVYLCDTDKVRALMSSDKIDYFEEILGEVSEYEIDFYINYYPDKDDIDLEMFVKVDTDDFEEIEKEYNLAFEKCDKVKETDKKVEIILTNEEKEVLKAEIKEWLNERDLINEWNEFKKDEIER